MVTNTHLKAILVGAAAFLLFVGSMMVASLIDGNQETTKMQICIEAGGSWDNGSEDCWLPGSTLYQD